MKKIIYPVAAGGAPYTNEVLVGLLQQEQYNAIEVVMDAISKSVLGVAGDNKASILIGCELTANVTPGQYDMANGVVWINKKILRVAAVTGWALPFYIKENATATTQTASAFTSQTFQDASNPNFVEEYVGQVVGSPPGSGQYITFSDATGNKEDRLMNLLSSNENYIEVGSGGSAPAFQNSWAGSSRLYFKKTRNKDIKIIGAVNVAAISGTVVFTMPTGYRPPVALTYLVRGIDDGVGVNLLCIVQTNGDVEVTGNLTSPTGNITAAINISFNID